MYRTHRSHRFSDVAAISFLLVVLVPSFSHWLMPALLVLALALAGSFAETAAASFRSRLRTTPRAS